MFQDLDQSSEQIIDNLLHGIDEIEKADCFPNICTISENFFTPSSPLLQTLETCVPVPEPAAHEEVLIVEEDHSYFATRKSESPASTSSSSSSSGSDSGYLSPPGARGRFASSSEGENFLYPLSGGEDLLEVACVATKIPVNPPSRRTRGAKRKSTWRRIFLLKVKVDWYLSQGQSG